MIGQSLAIIAIILILSFMSLRAGKRRAALLALPLVSVSALHLLGIAFLQMFTAMPAPTEYLLAATDLLGLVIGLFFCYKLSRFISVKKLKYAYFISCAVFMASLSLAYVLYHL